MTTACSDYPPSPMDEPNQADEWEISKENVAPLKQGRSVPSLNQALHMETPQRNEQLEQMKQLVFYVMESRTGSKRTPSAITSAATRFVPGNRSSTVSPLILQIYQVDAAKLSHRFASVFVGHRAVSPEVRGQSALPPGHALPSHLDHLHQFPGFSECEGHLLLHAVARNRNEARPVLSGGDDRVRAELRLRAHGTHLPRGHHAVTLPFIRDVDVRSRWPW